MKDEFEELLQINDRDRKAELEAFFLEKTTEKLKSTSKESALEVAASFDRFQKKADQEGDKMLKNLFEVLSQSIKDKFLDRKENLSDTNLEDY